MKKLTILCLSMTTLSLTQVNAKLPAPQDVVRGTDKQVLIENKGQWHPDVLYLARLGGLDVWITRYGINQTFYALEHADSPIDEKWSEHEPASIVAHRVVMKLKGHNPTPSVEGNQKQKLYHNYLIGNDPGKHAAFVGLYKEAVVKNVYHNIDMRYYFNQGSLRYDFIVHPGADPDQIRFTLNGSEKTYINDNGDLIFTTRFGEVQMAELNVFQSNKDNTVPARFKRNNDSSWGIDLGHYDKEQPLIIDPLIYSTYIGGNGTDYGYGIAVDGNGSAYVTGYTASADYDTTTGIFQEFGGLYDAFVSKLNEDGTGLIYSTFVGGGSDDEGYAIDVDALGNAYITGYASLDFPTTTGTVQEEFSGTYDVFVAKLNTTGSALLYATYLGGAADDRGLSIAVDNNGSAYVTGRTRSSDFDVTASAYQTTHGGINDVFVSKLNADGTALIYSTFLGSTSTEYGNGIALDDLGNAYITGFTSSNDFVTTAGALQTSYDGGAYDAFVTCLNSNGDGLIYSTLLGGSSEDRGEAIAVDNNRNAYVTGYTESTDFDISSGAVQSVHGGALHDAFVTKLNPTGTQALYSTYLGGSSVDRARSIALDNNANAFVFGITESNDYNIVPGAYQSVRQGSVELFLSKFNADGTLLLYSSYLGGDFDDQGYAITVDGNGNAYMAGWTASNDFDITPNAYQTAADASYEVFVTKLCAGTLMDISLSSAEGSNDQEVCENSPINTITYTTSNATGATFVGLPDGVSGSYDNGMITIDGAPTTSGTYTFAVHLTGNGCGTTMRTGTIVVDVCTGTTVRSPAIPWKVIPNPNTGHFTLRSEHGGVFELLDINGRRLNSYTVKQKNLTIYENLPSGIYLVRNKETNTVQKLMVE